MNCKISKTRVKHIISLMKYAYDNDGTVTFKNNIIRITGLRFNASIDMGVHSLWRLRLNTEAYYKLLIHAIRFQALTSGKT